MFVFLIAFDCVLIAKQRGSGGADTPVSLDVAAVSLG